jgi:hypothetical protein
MTEEMTMETGPLTIDEAITACEKVISSQRFNARFLLVLLALATWALYWAFKSLEQISQHIVGLGPIGRTIDATQIAEYLSKAKTYPFIVFGLYLAVFGIIIALYRFHMSEVARNEQIKLGFWRIRIAARNTTAGFQTEVRRSLTKDAFSFDPKVKSEKGKEIESPIPGHPASELATTVLNKIFDQIDVHVSKKEK